MALPKVTDSVTNITDQPVRPVISASALQALFDEIGKDLKTYLNDSLTVALESTTDGSSGADNIGATPLTSGTANTVQGIIEELDSKAVSGVNALNTHKTSADHDGRYYTEAEVNELLLENQQGNHLGTWQGYSPVQSDPGIQAIVNEHTNQFKDFANVLFYGMKGDGTPEDDTVLQNFVNNNRNIYFPSGTYLISGFTIPDNTIIKTDGYSTKFKQKSGLVGGTGEYRIITISGSNVILETASFEGNITTDSGEQNHAIGIRNNTKILNNIKIGDIVALDIRGDALEISGYTNKNPINVTVGNVYANNCYRNGVSVTGAINLTIGNIYAIRCGVLGLDFESDTTGGHIKNVTVGNVYAGGVGFLAAGTGYDYVECIKTGFLYLNKSLSGSTPDYPTVSTDKSGATFRNSKNILIDGMYVSGFDVFAIEFMLEVGDRINKDIIISNLTTENCSLNDIVYSTYMNVVGVETLTIKNLQSVIQTGKRLFKGNGDPNNQSVIIENGVHYGGGFCSNCEVYAKNLKATCDTSAFSNMRPLSKVEHSTITAEYIVGYSGNFFIESSYLNYTAGLELGTANLYSKNIINGVFTA